LATLAPEKQPKALAGILNNKMSVADFKARLGQFAHKLADAVFDTTQCASCVHNSGRQAMLFSEALGEGFWFHNFKVLEK
jgi:ParB family chromosome partitioning protein